jgi:hypothetical protein
VEGEGGEWPFATTGVVPSVSDTRAFVVGSAILESVGRKRSRSEMRVRRVEVHLLTLTPASIDDTLTAIKPLRPPLTST